ncbi:MAG: hypothetical protein HC904_05705 [Blastochloris sp.]|nr:hypothetical protein [Blastochloris sp.]
MECSPDDLLHKGQHQLRAAQSNACILNGPAWGPGYGLLTPDLSLKKIPDTPSLLQALTLFLE